MYGRMLLFASLMALPCATDGAGDTAVDRATLRGLKAVQVVIDPIHPELEKEGITRDALTTRIEQRLKSAGVPLNGEALEFLALKIVPARERRGPYCVSITLGVYQPVVLVRDSKVRTATDTWQVATLWVLQPKALYESTMSAVDELAGRFVEVYQAENPQGWRDSAPAPK
jgi:hypothetical protein